MRRYLMTFVACWLAAGCSNQPAPPPAAKSPIDVAGAREVAAKFLDTAKAGPDSGTARSFLSAEFRQRWNTPAAGPIRYFHYTSWRAGDPTVDDAARTVTLTGQVRATKSVERRDITEHGATVAEVPTGGDAEFTLVM